MPSTTTKLILAAAAVAAIAVVASKDKPADPPLPPIDPIPGTPQGGGGPAVGVLALTSQPVAGPVHNGVLRSDGTWTISTSAGSLVSQGIGEGSFLDRWLFYTQGGITGAIASGAILQASFTVRMPGCAPAAPNRWCYVTSRQQGLVRRAANRADALTRALARARVA